MNKQHDDNKQPPTRDTTSLVWIGIAFCVAILYIVFAFPLIQLVTVTLMVLALLILFLSR